MKAHSGGANDGSVYGVKIDGEDVDDNYTNTKKYIKNNTQNRTII